MIKIYTRTEGRVLHEVQRITQNSWIELINPTNEEIAEITQKLSLPSYFLEEATDRNVRPKLEQKGIHQLLVIHIPYDDPKIPHSSQDMKYRTVPYSIIMSGTHFITVSHEKTEFSFDYFLQENLYLGPSSHTENTLAILNKTAHTYISFTQQIEEEIAIAEDELSRSYRNPELYTLLYLNESLLFMAISLKQMLHTLRKIEQESALDMHKDDKNIFIDTRVELEQAYAITEINQLNSNNVMDAYGNIIQNNVSHIVKLLTALTIVLSIPTLIASIYGMNVPLPFQEEERAFPILIGIMIFLSVVVALVFRKKNYF